MITSTEDNKIDIIRRHITRKGIQYLVATGSYPAFEVNTFNLIKEFCQEEG